MARNSFVSILMTAYNRQQFIEEAIESVLASTYRDWELIIVDDGSTDNTVNIAKRFEASDTRIKVYVNEKNLGDYPNRNKAASYANGDFIIFVDSDDKILKDGIELLVKTMIHFPGASFGMYSTAGGEPFEIEPVKAIYNHFFEKPFLIMGPGGTIQRLSFFRKTKGYPEKYGPANDMYYNLKAACYSSIVIMPFEFMYYRRHEGQEINNASSYLYNSYLYLNDAMAELPLPLDNKQKKWIIKKNKRRFVVNLARLLFKLDFRKVQLAINKTRFTIPDLLQGIFH